MRNIVSYILVICFVAISSMMYASYELTYLVFFLVVLPVINIFIVDFSVRRIDVSYHSEISITNKRKNIPLFITVNNKGLLPVIMLEARIICRNNYHNSEEEISLDIPIVRYGITQFNFNIKSDSCGDMDVVLKSLKYKDYFKLFHRKKKLEKKISVYVMPSIGEIEDIEITKKELLDVDGERFSQSKKGDDPSEVFDIREYKPGDKLHSIHWKLSARERNFMVKDYSLPLNGHIGLIMDLSFSNNENIRESIDAITEIVLSIIMRFQQEGINHYLYGIERDREKTYKDIIDKDLSLVETMFEIYKSRYKKDSNILRSIESTGHTINESAIYLVTGNISKDTIISLENLYKGAYKKIIGLKTHDLNDEIVNYAIENNVEIELIDLDNFENDISKIDL